MKSAYTKFTIGKGDVFGLGNGKKGNVLILKGLKSKFTTHDFSFGDDI